MPLTSINPGPQTSLLQNVIYALPPRKATLYTTGSPTIQQSNLADMSNPTTVTLTDGQATVAGGFLRCSSANITVFLKCD